MQALHFEPRNVGPNEDPTIELNTFNPQEYRVGQDIPPVSLSYLPSKGAFPHSALTKSFSSDPVATSILSEKPNIFSTRTPNFNFSLDRVAMFENASPLTKNILEVLYGTRDNFVSATGHPLERYIFAFDENMDSDSTVRAIGSAMGLYIDIDPNFMAYELFIDKLIGCILVLEPTRINDAKYAGRPKIGDIIDMDREQFRKDAEKAGFEYSENLYQDRMNFYRYMSLTDEERFAEDNNLLEAYDTVEDLDAEPQTFNLLNRKYNSPGF